MPEQFCIAHLLPAYKIAASHAVLMFTNHLKRGMVKKDPLSSSNRFTSGYNNSTRLKRYWSSVGTSLSPFGQNDHLKSKLSLFVMKGYLKERKYGL